jgi:excisionase family DNA binding protein
MNRKQFAARVGISVPTLDRKLRDGDILPIRIGRRVLFAERHVQQFLNRFDTSRRKVLNEQ